MLATLVALGLALAAPPRPRTSATLDNGARLVVEVDRTVAAAAVAVLVGVGDAHEAPAERGAAHALEHLAFRAGARFGPGELRRAIMAAGGESYAATSREWTLYLLMVPTEALKLALEGLADCVLAPRIDPDNLRAERALLLQEYRQRQAGVASLVQEELFGLAFPDHGFGRSSAQAEDRLGGLNPELLVRFHRRHYVGANLKIAVVGDVQADALAARLRELFGAAAGDAPPPPLPLERPPKTEPRERQLELRSGSVSLALVVPGSRDPDYPALTALAEVLGGGELSRLWRAAVHEQGLARSASARLVGFRLRSLLELEGVPLETRDLAALERVLWQQLAALRQAPVEAEELELARARLLGQRMFDLEDYGDRVQRLAHAAALGDLNYELGFDLELGRLEPLDLLRAARRHLVSDRAVTFRLQPRGQASGSKDARREREVARAALPSSGAPVDWTSARPPVEPEVHPARAGGAELAAIPSELRLPSGLRVVLLPETGLPRVEIALLAPAGAAYDPPAGRGLAVLTNALLRSGAAGLERAAIARRFAALGGDYGFSTAMDSAGARLAVERERLEPGLELLAALWLQPDVPAADFERERAALLARIDQQRDSLGAAAEATVRARLYPEHPYGQELIGEAKHVERLGRADVVEFHRARYRVDASVLALVGDFEPDRAAALAARLFAAAPAEPPPAPQLAPPPPPRPGERIQQRAWLDAFLRACVRVPGLSAPEFADSLALQRLLALRYFDGLTYRKALVYRHSTTLASNPWNAELCVDTQVKPELAGAARREIVRQIELVAGGQIDAEELAAARRWALGALRMERMSAAARARTLAILALYGLPAATYLELPERLAAVDLESAREVAARYLRPDLWVAARIEPEQP